MSFNWLGELVLFLLSRAFWQQHRREAIVVWLALTTTFVFWGLIAWALSTG